MKLTRLTFQRFIRGYRAEGGPFLTRLMSDLGLQSLIEEIGIEAVLEVVGRETGPAQKCRLKKKTREAKQRLCGLLDDKEDRQLRLYRELYKKLNKLE